MSRAGLDPIGWYIAITHQMFGHDKAAAFMQVPGGDKAACVLCRYEHRPGEQEWSAVLRALAPAAQD